MHGISREFHEAMIGIYLTAKSEAGYRATRFIEMVNREGGLATAKRLINAPRPSEGYTHLYERGRLDLTVEALVAGQPKWHVLYTAEDLKNARKRLSAFGYQADAGSSWTSQR